MPKTLKSNAVTPHPARISANLVVMLSGLALSTPNLMAQNAASDPEPAAVAEAMEMELLEGPQNLPGQEPGDRTRPEAAPEPDAAKADEPREWFGGKPYWEWSRAAGDLGGVRTALENWGLTLAGSHTLDLVGAWSGGLDHRSTSARLLDFNATLDLEKVFGLKGGSVYVDTQVSGGNSPSRRVGDFQGTSNLESVESQHYVTELWYQQWLFDNVLRVKLGKIDGNKEFDFTAAGAEFLNAAAGIDTTNALLPCYPDPATAVVAFVYPTKNWYLGFGFFDGAGSDGVLTGGRGPATFFSDDLADGFFYTGETGVTFDLGFIKDLRIAAGVWHHDDEFTKFNGGTRDGTTGFYVLSEGTLWKRSQDDKDDARGLSAFIRYGHADDEVFASGNNLGGGLKLLGTFDGRDTDSCGVFVGWADMSDADGAGFESDETTIEVYYRWNITPFVHLVPDLQFVFDPFGSEQVGDAVVGSLRVTVDF
jgi:porin